MPVVICPGCSTRLSIDAKTSGKFACPKCKKEMRLKQPASTESFDSNNSDSDPNSIRQQNAAARPTSSSAAMNAASPPSGPSVSSKPSSAAPQNRATSPAQRQRLAPMASQATPQVSSPQGSMDMAYAPSSYSGYAGGGSSQSKVLPSDFRQFATKLGSIVAVMAVAILVSLPLTQFSDSFLCLIPIILAMSCILGLAFWSRIWFIVLGFGQSTGQGLMVLLVPYYWLYFVSQNKQKSVKPLAVLGGSIVPGLLGAVIVLFFKPEFTSPDPRTEFRQTNAQRAEARKILLQATSGAKPDEVVTVQFQVHRLLGPNAAIAGELALLQLPGYVTGSLKMAPDQKSITLQYRGTNKEVAIQYALALPGEAGLLVGFEPTFIENSP